MTTDKGLTLPATKENENSTYGSCDNAAKAPIRRLSPEGAECYAVDAQISDATGDTSGYLTVPGKRVVSIQRRDFVGSPSGRLDVKDYWMWDDVVEGSEKLYNYMSSYRSIHSLTRYQHSNSPYHKLLYMNLFPRSLLWAPGLRYKRSGNQIWLASWTFSMVSVEKMPSSFIFAAFAHHFVCCRRCRQDRRSRALFSPLSYFVIYFSKRSCGRRFSGSHSVDRSRKISQKLHNRGGLGGGGRRSPCHVFPLSGLRYSLNYIFERRPIPFDRKNCITHEV